VSWPGAIKLVALLCVCGIAAGQILFKLGADALVANGGKLLSAGGAVVAGALVGVSAMIEKPPVRYMCPPNCGKPPTGTPVEINPRFTAADGADFLDGSAGNDTLTGGPGNDTMNGGTGQNVFKFAAGFGNDTINAFDANPAGGGQDRLDISSLGIRGATFAANVTIASDGAGGTLVTIGGNTIQLVSVAPADVTTADFILAP